MVGESLPGNVESEDIVDEPMGEEKSFEEHMAEMVASKETEKNNEYVFDFFSSYKNGSLHFSNSGASPKLLSEHPDLADDGVTGFEFVFGKGEKKNQAIESQAQGMGLSSDLAEAVSTSREEFKNVYYFTGAEIVDYDKIENLFDRNKVSEEDKQRKYVVSKGKEGEIVDVRPILDGDEVHIVDSEEELMQIYEDITGYSYPKGEN